MSKVFDIHVLPAQRGDAIWIEYGSGDARHHILIDGGISATGRDHVRKRIEEVGTPLHIELLVVTHIDLDHIEGVLELLDDLPAGVTFGDIWFNGYDQLKQIGLEPMGVKQGIKLSEILTRDHAPVWNKATEGAPVALGADGAIRQFTLPGGMRVQVIGPGHAQLQNLSLAWDTVLEEFGADEGAGPTDDEDDPPLLAPGLEVMGAADLPEPAKLASTPFKQDVTVPNGSSIALALHFADRTALMLGDAYPSVVCESLAKLATEGVYRADAVKLPHHGSRNNVSQDLADLIDAPTWIFSSNGANNTKHPHPEAVARVLRGNPGPKTLVFNYRTKFNEDWDEPTLKEEHEYQTTYGTGLAPVVIALR